MELTIEKLVYGGDGLARLEQADGKRKTVFVPLVLPEERVDAEIVEERPGFARARLERVIEPSAQRVMPPCPYFGECGGCRYQHTTYEEQLKLKRDILRETIARIAKIELPEIEVHASPPLNYRNRTRMKFAIVAGAETKFVIGYHKLGSRQLLPVRECPISSPLINRALAALWDLALTHDLPKGLAEVQLFTNAADDKLQVDFLAQPNPDRASLEAFAGALSPKVPQVSGITLLPHIHTEDDPAAPELEGAVGAKADTLFGRDYLDYEAAEFTYRVSAGSFFQTNRHLAATLIDLACRNASGKLAIELYAGVGLFTVPLAKSFDRVVAVEAAPSSFADLKSNASRNTKTVESTSEAFLEHTRQKPDFVVVDPPRAGLGKRVVSGVKTLSPKSLAYVSCDPSTLARDLAGLTAAGYRVTEAHLVDLFPQTFHIETVLRMER